MSDPSDFSQTSNQELQGKLPEPAETEVSSDRPFFWISVGLAAVGVVAVLSVLWKATPSRSERLFYETISGPKFKDGDLGHTPRVLWEIAGEDAETRKAVFDHLASSHATLENGFSMSNALLHAIVGTDPDVRQYIIDIYVQPGLKEEKFESQNLWQQIARELRAEGVGRPGHINSDRAKLEILKSRRKWRYGSISARKREQFIASHRSWNEAIAEATDSQTMAAAFLVASDQGGVCTPRNLFNFLKYPQCIGVARVAVLDKLEKVTGEEFGNNLWNAVGKYVRMGLTDEVLREPATGNPYQ